MPDLCIHEFELGNCGHCKLPPAGVNKIVYVTKGGMAFHNKSNCETLTAGQEEADEKGMNIHPINPIGWADAFKDRRPCRNCCPEYQK